MTAVEFAVEKLEKFIPSGNQLVIRIILEQAKEMEKEQMMQSYEDGYNRVAKLIEDAANKMVNLKL
jgi:hypothetical protein